MVLLCCRYHVAVWAIAIALAAAMHILDKTNDVSVDPRFADCVAVCTPGGKQPAILPYYVPS